MSIDFTWLDKQNGPDKVTLTDSSFKRIEKALNKLKEKTGLFVDPYSDTRISPDHAQLLQTLIIDSCSERTDELEALEDMLRKSAEKSWWILVEGD